MLKSIISGNFKEMMETYRKYHPSFSKKRKNLIPKSLYEQIYFDKEVVQNSKGKINEN